MKKFVKGFFFPKILGVRKSLRTLLEVIVLGVLEDSLKQTLRELLHTFFGKSLKAFLNLEKLKEFLERPL